MRKIKTKLCTRCHRRKKIIEFSKDKTHKDNYNSWCKKCRKIYNKKYREEHKEKMKKYYQKHEKKIRNQHKKWCKKNTQKIKKYYQKHKCKILEQHKKRSNKRRKNDINFKLICYLRTRIYNAIKQNSKSKSTIELLDCTIPELKQHLENQFKKDMTWNNYGKWHTDHIKTCASFDLSKPEDQKKCFHYTNLRPLWAEENLSRQKNEYQTKK